MSDIFKPSFELPPAKALEFFKNKGLETSFSYLDMMHDSHSTAFTVAKMMDIDLLGDVHKAMGKAIESGETLKQFSEKLIPELISKGWWGKGKMVDPLTGEEKDVQLGSVRRLKTIFLTNMRTSLMAGQWADIQENKKMFPYLMYDAVKDNRTRPQHRGWDGLILSVDDPFWNTHYPPNGWNCRCDVIQLNARMLKQERELQRQKDKDKNIPAGPDRSPSEPELPWKNPRTGEIIPVPRGVDPSFAYNVGKSQAQHINKTFEEKAREAEKEFKLQPKTIETPELFKLELPSKEIQSKIGKLVDEGKGKLAASNHTVPSHVSWSREFFKKYIEDNEDRINTAAGFYEKNLVIYLNPDYNWKDNESETVENYEIGYWSTDDPRHFIYHEAGHLNHFVNNPDAYKMAKGKLDGKLKEKWELAKADIKSKVSDRALENPIEFVAEVFAGLMAGKQYDNVVKAWYNFFGGEE